MDKCSRCGKEVSRSTTAFFSDPVTGKVTSVTYCAFCAPGRYRDVAKNPFENFTLQNVLDENHKPITVNSLSELRRVEKENNVALAMMSMDDISQPPQHAPWAGDIFHGRGHEWNKNPEAYSAGALTEAAKQTGYAARAEDTLVDHPNPL